jgi:hypothetical protein
LISPHAVSREQQHSGTLGDIQFASSSAMIDWMKARKVDAVWNQPAFDNAWGEN